MARGPHAAQCLADGLGGALGPGVGVPRLARVGAWARAAPHAGPVSRAGCPCGQAALVGPAGQLPGARLGAASHRRPAPATGPPSSCTLSHLG